MIITKAKKILREEGIFVLLKKAVGKLRQKVNFVLVPYATVLIKNARFKNTSDLMNFSFNRLLGLVTPAQVKEEISGLLQILLKAKPKYMLEIGTANGGTLFLFSRTIAKDAKIISVDLPGGKFGGGYPEWKIPFYKSFALPTQDMHLLRMSSHDSSTLDLVKETLSGKKLDFLFIDGDHTYDGVKKDFEMYSQLVRRGGIIAFHDIAKHPPEINCNVDKFWLEIKKRYRNTELIKDRNQGRCGIGVLYV